MKVLAAILFFSLSSILFGQINTMTFNGTSTTASGVTFSFTTGAFVNSSDGTAMSLYSNHPYATPVNGGNDYKDISISQAIYITTVNVSWATNVAGFKLQFLRSGSVVKELSSLILGDATVNVLADKIRFYDTGVSNSGGFELANVKWNSSLPVELLSFVATLDNDIVILNCKTATEVNNYGFEVERSSGGSTHFEKIGFIHGHGNSNSPHEYTFTDNTPVSGEAQYRLKQIDNDGQFKYYGPVSVNCGSPNQYKLLQNTPNPFNPSTAIRFQLPAKSQVSIIIYDMLGREVTDLINEGKSAGTHIVYWNGRDMNGQMVSSGVYLYKLSAGNYTETRKMNFLK